MEVIQQLDDAERVGEDGEIDESLEGFSLVIQKSDGKIRVMSHIPIPLCGLDQSDVFSDVRLVECTSLRHGTCGQNFLLCEHDGGLAFRDGLFKCFETLYFGHVEFVVVDLGMVFAWLIPLYQVFLAEVRHVCF